ncbi:MAG: CvpA family protein, partial [Altererythrobacter sp.]|nr:CvpA family protein [Altererythrobacter sp.]NNK45082.1 CvpA family protein [Altererythrobacter sp.]
MNGFDIIVMIIVGVAAVGGFLRGLVQEVLSLAAWALAAAAIYYLHEPFTEILLEYLDVEPTTSILA